MSRPDLTPFTFTEPILTSRLRLRLMTADDVDDVHAYLSREDVTRYLPDGPRTRDEVAVRVAEQGASTVLAAEGSYVQPVIELPSDVAGERGRVIGSIYFTIRSVEHRGAEIGWTLHPDVQGRGYAAEAADAMLRLGFEQVGLHRVVAELDPRNESSSRLARRLGMRLEATFVRDYWLKDEWGDTDVYALLEDEWRARTT